MVCKILVLMRFVGPRLARREPDSYLQSGAGKGNGAQYRRSARKESELDFEKDVTKPIARVSRVGDDFDQTTTTSHHFVHIEPQLKRAPAEALDWAPPEFTRTKRKEREREHERRDGGRRETLRGGAEGVGTQSNSTCGLNSVQ